MTAPRHLRAALALVAGLLAGCAAAEDSSSATAEGLPFLGTWDCEVAFFTFTPETYSPGQDTDPLAYVEVEAIDADTRGAAEDPTTATEFVLTFDDGYQIGLSSVTEESMAWFSGASGDTFDCLRQTP